MFTLMDEDENAMPNVNYNHIISFLLGADKNCHQLNEILFEYFLKLINLFSKIKSLKIIIIS